MPNCSISIQVLPEVNKEKLFYVVDRVIEYIKAQGVKYVVGPFDTTIEGDFEKLMEIIKTAQLIAVESGAEGVFSNVKIAYNPKGVYTIDEKISKHIH